MHRTLEPCSLGLVALCPIETGNVAVDSQVQVSPDIAKQIPGQQLLRDEILADRI